MSNNRNSLNRRIIPAEKESSHAMDFYANRRIDGRIIGLFFKKIEIQFT